MKAAIVGIAGAALTAAEQAQFRRHQPAGVILFARNIRDPTELAGLTAALRQTLPPGAVLMVDQEGGRVARLRPPHWRAHPPAATIGARYAADPAAGLRLAWLTGALIGLDCAASGFDVACAPVLDLRQAGAHDIIGDRAFSADPADVATLAAAFAAGLLAAGIQPVGKHAPGHGRALVDSHLELPRVTATADQLAADLKPFAALTHLPWMMTAHICYATWDATRPATLSPTVIADIIRGRIGFDGLLVSDDLAMKALAGTPGDLAAAALAAGCDLALHCSGDADATAAVLEAAAPLTAAATTRLARAHAQARHRRQPRVQPALAAAHLDPDRLDAERADLLA